MSNLLINFLKFSPFDESMDRKNTQALLNSYRVFTVIVGLFFIFCGVFILIVSPNNHTSTGFSLYAMGASLKAIEVLIDWHLGLKAMAKNSLVLVLFITLLIVLIKGI